MRYILTAAFCFYVLLVAAQKETNRLDHKAAISISPLALADMDNGIMLGGEYRFRPGYALILDASYIFHSYYFAEPREVSGFTVRPAFRFYPGNKMSKEFFQVQGFYKQADYAFYGWLDKNVVNGVPSYSQIQDYTYKKEVWGVNFMVGVLETLNSGRFYLDISGGLGVRFKRQGVSEPNSQMRQRQNMGIYKDKMTTISLPCNVKLAYGLGRR